jgi:hypothetical protein
MSGVALPNAVIPESVRCERLGENTEITPGNAALIKVPVGATSSTVACRFSMFACTAL